MGTSFAKNFINVCAKRFLPCTNKVSGLCVYATLKKITLSDQLRNLLHLLCLPYPPDWKGFGQLCTARNSLQMHGKRFANLYTARCKSLLVLYKCVHRTRRDLQYGGQSYRCKAVGNSALQVVDRLGLQWH